MSTGQVWRRANGLRWAEIQAPAVDPSGWRLMVPLIGRDDAVDIPPFVITVGDHRARVHLLTSVHVDDLGTPDGRLSPDDVDELQMAARALLAGH